MTDRQKSFYKEKMEMQYEELNEMLEFPERYYKKRTDWENVSPMIEMKEGGDMDGDE